MRSAGCCLPSLASSAEKEAYAKVAVASSKVMEAFNEYVWLSKELEVTKREGKKDAEKIEALTKDWKRIHQENEALMTQMVAQKARIAALEVERDLDIRCASRVAHRDIATRYREILESLKDKWTSRKKGVSAEIQLHKVIANIDLLNELKDGGLTIDAELARLKEMEGDCEDLVASAAVSDLSISELDRPQVSDDSVDQVGGTFVLDDSASTFEVLFVWVVEIRHDLDPYKASLCFRIYHSVSFNFVFACQRNMASRRSNPRDSDRVQTRTGSANAEHIRSGDVSEALT
ncbi:hypothetical protein DY000_02010234 [Brassica cretica]|uniref:Uncharacterized protein n=1 Tax=Brassica cretica TaxID=69181 RepID=A0ABQ7CF36_BRACR|nr:hypothetical protein DY000_02010234 [Brassica cretica]